MKVLSFGSFNIDHTYHVDHFVAPGETESTISYHQTPGGKGFNQTMALIKAQAAVLPAGCIGHDGQMFMDILQKYHQTTDLVHEVDDATGHAIIQVADGQNTILIYGGANQQISEDHINEAISYCDPGDILLIQNEINNLDRLIEKAYERKMKIVFNMAPMNKNLLPLLAHVDVIAVNEIEASQLLGVSSVAEDVLIEAFRKQFPHKEILLTLGAGGSVYLFEDMKISVPARKVSVTDTTAAGDTYIGYYLAALENHHSIKEAMEIATRASSLTVMKKGSSVSIPDKKEVVESFIKEKYRQIPVLHSQSVSYKKGIYDRDVPVFDKETKNYVYALYSSGLLGLKLKASDQPLDKLDLSDSMGLLIQSIRAGKLDKRQLAKQLADGTIARIDAHIRELIEE